jgi:hypothetical protein
LFVHEKYAQEMINWFSVLFLIIYALLLVN